MQASELLTDNFPTLKPGDSLSKAVELFLDTCVAHFPIVAEDDLLQGILPADVALAGGDGAKNVSDVKEDWVQAAVLPGQHGLQIFEIAAKYQLTSIPVVTEERRYTGTITTEHLLSTIGNLYSFKNIGGIIVLNVGARDYDLAEIARIISSNNAKILVLYMDSNEMTGDLTITLKVNTLELSHIIATFERYSYKIPYFYPSVEKSDDMKDRYDLLMKLFDL